MLIEEQRSNKDMLELEQKIVTVNVRVAENKKFHSGLFLLRLGDIQTVLFAQGGSVRHLKPP